MSSSGKGKEVVSRCAACQNLQRPYCVPGCVFALYFPFPPGDERFAAVREAFDLDKLTEFLSRKEEKNPDEATRAQVAQTLVDQARRWLARLEQQQQSAAAGGAVVPPPPWGGVREPSAALFLPGDDSARFAAVHHAQQQQLAGAQQPSAAAGGAPGAIMPQPPPPRGSGPCAACRHARSGCGAGCELAPYFPPGGDSTARFEDVRKVFGSKNFTAMLRQVSPEQRADAAASLIYEAQCRRRNPVYGITGTISALEEELRQVYQTIAAVKLLTKHYRMEAESTARFVAELHLQQLPAAGDSMAGTGIANFGTPMNVDQQWADGSMAGVANFGTPMDQQWAHGVIAALLEQPPAADVPAFLMLQPPPHAPTAAADVPGSSTGVTAVFQEPPATVPAFLMQQPPPQAPTAAADDVQDQDAGLPDLNTSAGIELFLLFEFSSVLRYRQSSVFHCVVTFLIPETSN
ncbi:hypothetical protein EJB05_14993 [Eragrostis curvula]|uniref:LOB domain-containing protein n=1 Tax=Eragrostis curvula TaxID=38414 RepID=A0A5J9VYE4_9POAL|nr:hypothetical protein EJB05_14993 [Eragrostis curvula]